MTPLFEPLPPQAPRRHPRWLRACAAAILRLLGWRLVGRFPEEPRLVIVVAPHSSAWDAVYGLLLKVATGLDLRFMAKRELFWFPLGNLLKALGAIPVDRRSPHGVVGATVEGFRRNTIGWLLLAPEGTRKAVQRWKSGFWHIARQADVPVCAVYVDYPAKQFGIVPELFRMSDDMDADIARVRAAFAPYRGKHRGA